MSPAGSSDRSREMIVLDAALIIRTDTVVRIR